MKSRTTKQCLTRQGILLAVFSVISLWMISTTAFNQKVLRFSSHPFVASRRNFDLSMVSGLSDGFHPFISDDDDGKQNLHNSTSVVTEFESSLAIIPSLKDWDRLQRARHFARDPVFHEWPPAIRLFHPFDRSPDAAFDVAQIIEDLEIESFQIKMDSWIIIPNLEATKKEWDNQQQLPDVLQNYKSDSYYEQLNRESDEEVREQIASEEIKANIKAMKNKGTTRTQQKRNATKSSPSKSKKEKKSFAQKRNEQRRMIEDDFGGPCVLCLEPDEESKESLMELREMLREGLDLDSYFSPSSLYSSEFVSGIDMGYRPLIPISKFNSFQSAMDVARRLKGLWGKPLTIDVKSLDLISCKSQDGNVVEKENWNTNVPLETELKKEAWGRNAKIMLYGEEVGQDEEANERMVEQILQDGETGGGDISADYTILHDEEESLSDIEIWLDEEDDDFDEGMQVIIGRTHIFTGDQRHYKGMPATSVVDFKDRSLGESGSVSGLARR